MNRCEREVKEEEEAEAGEIVLMPEEEMPGKAGVSSAPQPDLNQGNYLCLSTGASDLVGELPVFSFLFTPAVLSHKGLYSHCCGRKFAHYQPSHCASLICNI